MFNFQKYIPYNPNMAEIEEENILFEIVIIKTYELWNSFQSHLQDPDEIQEQKETMAS